MNRKELIRKIIQKKEFLDLPEKDVLIAFEKFGKDKYTDEEKVKLTRDLLRKVFSAFASKKLLLNKDKGEEWILKKHLSTRERFPYYEKIYSRLFGPGPVNLSVIDLGAGINGFSYKYFQKPFNYIAVEGVGQLVDLMNSYFEKNKLSAEAFHLSLFDIEGIKKLILKQKKPRTVLLLKTIDSLEMMERNYSKRLLKELVEISDGVVISFATRSMVKRKKFFVNRKWLNDFIDQSFNVTDKFEMGDEEYIAFRKRY